MSPLRRGRASIETISSDEVNDRASALSGALVTGSDELEPRSVERARRVVDKAVQRSGIRGDHTVVALAGATGSGKSSLFNALVGADVSTIGARRPTTSLPTAAIWGDDDASELLDWLEVDARHVVASSSTDRPGAQVEGEVEGGFVGSLDGLVLLDLPDFDSREVSHRVEAERVLELVDVFVWVTDPQKYADARLHDDFVAILSLHGAVTVAVLNQSDRLTPAAVSDVSADLAGLLLADGVAGLTVLPTSTLTGAGLDALRQGLANAVAGHAASRQRLRSDLVGAAKGLRRGVADSEPDVASLDRAALDEALARAAGVPIVLDAVARDYRREAFAHTGFLFTRWTKGFAADPLRRLRLDRTGGRPQIPVDIEGADVRAVLGRSSIPAPTAATASAVDLATRTFVRDASDGLPVRWQQSVEDSVDQGDGALADALDQAMVGAPLRARRPAWWLVVNVIQWALGIVALGGLAWLAVLWGLGLLQFPRPDTPSYGIVPVPVVLLVGGILLGLGLGLLSRWWARIGARRRRVVVGRRLTTAVAAVTDERILTPVAAVLTRHRDTRTQLDTAAG
ncbi:MAG: GTPase [Humibacillus sp.]